MCPLVFFTDISIKTEGRAKSSWEVSGGDSKKHYRAYETYIDENVTLYSAESECLLVLAALQTVTLYKAEGEYLLVLATLQTVTCYNAESEYLLELATLQTVACYNTESIC